MARNVRRSFVRSGAKRKTLWIGIGSTASTLTSSGGTILNSLNAAALALRPFTVVRTHLELLVRSDQIANSEDQVGALGVAIVSDQAVAIGVTAVPTPITDSSSDLWLLHKPFMNTFRLSSAVGISNAAKTYTVDSKAMRKVEDGQDFIVVVENDTSVGAGLGVLVSGRVLVKAN